MPRDCTAQLSRKQLVEMYSPRHVTRIPYMTKRKTKNKKKNRRQKQSRPKQQPMSIGAQIGDGLQKMAISAWKRLVGQGDYVVSPNVAEIKENALMSDKPNNQPPRWSSSNTFLVEHCEYVGDIAGTTAFNVNGYTINPSNAALFPWLSGISKNFEYYQIEGMIVRYVSTSGSATGSNTALGTVLSYIAYDDVDSLPGTKAQALQYEGVVDAKPSENFLVGVECDPSRLVMKRLYTGSPAPGTDSRFHNFGRIVVATQGMQSTNTIGELWVHYKIRFHVSKSNLTDTFFQYIQFANLGTGITNALPLANVAVTNYNPVGLSFSSTSYSFTMTAGAKYIINFAWNGTSATCNYPSLSFAVDSGPNATTMAYDDPNTTNNQRIGLAAGASSTYLIQQHIVQSNHTAAQLVTCTLSSAQLPASAVLRGFVVRMA